MTEEEAAAWERAFNKMEQASHDIGQQQQQNRGRTCQRISTTQVYCY